MTHEEFLESRRKSNFKADYTPEENAYWMEAQRQAAVRNASGRIFPAKQPETVVEEQQYDGRMPL